jgi:hypothetical protein
LKIKIGGKRATFMNDPKIKKDLSQTPPLIPKKLTDLERAINLLGNRVKSDLKMKSRQELEQLLGAYPTVPQSAVWKQFLKSLRKESLETQ